MLPYWNNKSSYFNSSSVFLLFGYASKVPNDADDSVERGLSLYKAIVLVGLVNCYSLHYKAPDRGSLLYFHGCPQQLAQGLHVPPKVLTE